MKKPTDQKFVITWLLILLSAHAFSQDLIPLTENNQWMYERYIVESGKEITDTVQFLVDKPVIVNGKEWFPSYNVGSWLMLRNTPEGHYELDSAEVDAFGNFRQFMVYKNPQKNKTLHYKLRNGGVVSVTDQLYPIETAIGTFDCYKYSINYRVKEEYRIDTYVSPGVGMVFSDIEISGHLVQMKLIRYRIH